MMIRIVMALIFRFSYKNCCKDNIYCLKSRKYTKYCFRSLYFQEQLAMAIDSSLEIMTISYIAFTVAAKPLSGEVLGYIIAVFGLSLVLIFLPIGVIILMCRASKEKILQSE